MNKKAFASQFALAALFIVVGITAVFYDFENSNFSSITGRDVFIAAVPTVNNVFINSTFGLNSTNENLTVY
jgi:hypothetical protein